MRGFHWSFLSFLFQISAFSSAVPIDALPITRRSHFCANAPTTVAGTLLHRALPSPHPKRFGDITSSITWCATGTRTYIVTTLHPAITGTAILTLLDAAHGAIATQLRLHGDALIPGGAFDWAGDLGAGLTMLNANNHQLTWATLAAALDALRDEMHRLALGGAAGYFTIVDGETEVGTGRIFDPWSPA